MVRRINLLTTVLLCLTFSYNSIQAQVAMPSLKDKAHLQSLNGTWKFKYFPSEEMGSDSLFYQPPFDVKNWDAIKVPGNWELQGFAEPKYGKELAEGIGLYRTKFNVKKAWRNKPVYLAFDGVLYGYKVWVNGHYVGRYSSGYNRHIFDISSYIQTGKTNVLAVKVVTHPKGWDFDTNDAWSLSGIFRDVTLFSLPEVHLKDLTIQTPVHSNSASVRVEGSIETISNQPLSEDLKIMGELSAPDGKSVRTFTIQPSLEGSEPIAHFSTLVSVPNPKLWTAETPFLYHLHLSLYRNGTEIQEYTRTVGLREVTWNNGILKLNGKPITLKGVNHHDLSPLHGRAITEKEMKEDIELMQKANVNFIRTSHYPPNPRFLELCDSMGMYVMDEVPFGFGDKHLYDTTYLPLLFQRAKATIHRDKNHPGVIVWSVGNENPVTDMVRKVGNYVRSLDTTRPYCYPLVGSYFRKIINSGKLDEEEVLAAHYPSVSDVRRYSDKFHRPLIFSEFAHSMGTGFGRMQDIFQIIYASPKLAGGAVWAFFDQGILRKADHPISKNESTRYAWPSPNSYYDTHDFDGMDGIVYANRKPQVDFWQVRKVYAPVVAMDDSLQYKQGTNNFKIKVINRYDFTNLSQIKCNWQLYGDKEKLHSGKISLSGKPHDTVTMEIKTSLPDPHSHAVYYLKLAFLNKNQDTINEKSYLFHTDKNLFKQLKQDLLTKKIKPKKKGSSIQAKNYQFTFQQEKGEITLKNKSENLLITSGPFARLGRKITVCEEAADVWDTSKHHLWTPFLLHSKMSRKLKFTKHQLKMQYSYEPESPANRQLRGTVNYDFTNKGSIRVHYHFVPNGDGLGLETGLSFLIPSSLTEFRWIGKGPYASYPGKDVLSDFGIFHLNSGDIYYPGNRQEVSCAVFSDTEGNGFALLAPKANIAVERTEKGIIVSQNATIAGRFNKRNWPPNVYHFEKGKAIEGSFIIIPLSNHWSKKLIELFGNPKEKTKVFAPFFNSYDQ